jgi:general secretion pathway protein I
MLMYLKSKQKKSSGFTLLEVLVALIFFSLIGLVIQQVSASTVSQYQTVRLKMFGTWIAENKMAELRLSDTLPAPKEYKEELSYGGMDWELVSNVIATENPFIMRVELASFSLGKSADDKRQRASLTSFVGLH